MITVIGVLSGVIAGVPLLVYMLFHPIQLTGAAAEATLQFGIEPIMPFSIEPSIFITQAIAVVALSMVSAFYPVWVIKRFNVVESMRA